MLISSLRLFVIPLLRPRSVSGSSFFTVASAIDVWVPDPPAVSCLVDLVARYWTRGNATSDFRLFANQILA